MNIKQKRPTSGIALLLGALGGLVFVSFLICSFTGAYSHFHSDSAAVIAYAREEVLTGNFFPSGWYHASDILIFFFNLVAAPLSFMIKNSLLLRSLSVLIFAAVTVAALYVFHRKVLKDNAWIVSISIVFSGISIAYLEFMLVQAAYLPAFLLTIIALSLYLTAVDEDYCITNKWIFILFLFLAIFLGLSGMRYIQTITLPLFCTIATLYLLKHLSSGFEEVKKTLRRPFFLLLALGIAIVLGICGFYLIKQTINYVSGMSSPQHLYLTSGNDLEQNFSNLCNGLLLLIGFVEGSPLFSIAGIKSMFRLCVGLLILIIIPVFIIKNFRKQSYKFRFFFLFTIWNIAMTLYLLLFTPTLWYDIQSIRYFLISFVLLIVIEASFLCEHFKQMSFLVKAGSLIMLSVWIVFNCHDMNLYNRNAQAIVSQKREITSFLEEHDLHYGYATYWNAAENTARSNFSVQINSINYGPASLSPHRWLSSERWYQPNNYEGKTFLLFTNEELEFIDSQAYRTLLGAPEEILTYGDYTIWVFPDNIAQYAWIADLSYNSIFEINGHMLFNQFVQKQDNDGFDILHQGVLFGPYLTVSPGTYCIDIRVGPFCPKGITARITAQSGQKEIAEFPLASGDNHLTLLLDSVETEVEIVIENTTQHTFNIKEIKIQKTH